MQITPKLLSFLNWVFDKDPGKFLALRLRYDGGMTWKIENAVLTTIIDGEPGENLSVDLSQYTLGSLSSYLAGKTGYTVSYIDGSELSGLSALVLIDASGDIDQSNGDHLYGYTNILWSYMEAAASELEQAETQIGEMLNQMSTRTGSGEWLDELGGYYDVPRLQGELDVQYGPRIIAEVLRPRANNVAMEEAISVYTGQTTTVRDVTLYGNTPPLYDATYSYDGTVLHDSVATPVYGLFDVEYGYDLINGGDVAEFSQVVRDLVNRLRDAGTHLRQLLLKASTLSDALTAPFDGADALPLAIDLATADTLDEPSDSSEMSIAFAQMADPLGAPSDEETIDISYSHTYSGLRLYNGIMTHNSGSTVTESL